MDYDNLVFEQQMFYEKYGCLSPYTDYKMDCLIREGKATLAQVDNYNKRRGNFIIERMKQLFDTSNVGGI